MTVEPSTIFGAYQIQRKLGQGGMGTVYLAQHVDLDRLVALKTIDATWQDDTEQRARFRREAESALRIDHPGVVKFYDHGMVDGVAFLAMEYVAGRTLARALADEGAWRPARVVWLLDELLDALSALHAEGLVHRDVTPSNVMLADDGRIRLLDLGLAKFLDSTPLTDPGRAVGTPAYLPPEAILGDAVGPESDIYQVGLLARELATGEAAYTGPHVVEMLAQIVNGPRLPPLRVRGSLGTPLSLFVSRATAPRPELRFRSAHAARDALSRLTRRAGRSRRRGTDAATVNLARAVRRHAGRSHVLARLVLVPAALLFAAVALLARLTLPPSPAHRVTSAVTSAVDPVGLCLQLSQTLGKLVTESDVKSLRTKMRHRLNRRGESLEVLSTWRSRYRQAFLTPQFEALARGFLAVRDQVPGEPRLEVTARTALLRGVEDLADLNALIRESFGDRWGETLVELDGGRFDGQVLRPPSSVLALVLRFGDARTPPGVSPVRVPGPARFSCGVDPLLEDTPIAGDRRPDLMYPPHPTMGRQAVSAWLGVRLAGGRSTEKLVFWLGSAGTWREVAFVRADGREAPHEEWREIDARLLSEPGAQLRVTFEYRSVPVIPRGIEVGWIALAIVPR